MNIETIELYEKYLQLEAIENFLVYRYYLNPKLKLGWFVKDLARNLQQFYQDFVDGKKPKLIIEAPPQHGKSTAIIDFASWMIGKQPDTKIIYTSFSERLGIRANLKVQRILDSKKYKAMFGQLLNTSNVVSISGQYLRNRDILEFLNHEGFFRNTTVRGSITGESLDLGIIDDPIKGREEADSQVVRDKTWDWFTDDFFSRFSELGALLGILTRWHVDDPIGRLIAGDKTVKVLKYRAIAEEDEKYRKAGEALFPEHKSKEFLEERKKLMPVRSWNSLYQQNPTISEGNFFKKSNFQYYQEQEKHYVLSGRKVSKADVRIYQTIDPAGTENKTSDYFAAITFGVFENNIIVLDTFKERAETTRHEMILRNLRDKWNPVYQAVENRTFGLNIIQSAKKSGIPIMPLEADKSKIYRAEPLEIHFQNSLVWLNPEHKELEKELLEFPNGKHDDLVDCLAYAVILLNQKKNKLTILDLYGT